MMSKTFFPFEWLAALAIMACVQLIPSQAGYAQEAEPSSPLADQTWVRLGGPIGGLGYDIRMRPDNPDIMYVTDAWAGVHKSTDGGQTWYSLNEGIDARTGPSGDAIPVFCLTIDPNSYDIIWIGTQSFRGVYRSVDGGSTWEKRTNGIIEGNELTVRGIAVEPGNSDVVYVSGEISQNNWGREFDRVKGVVYKSTDTGMNWQAIWRGDSLARYVLIDPTDVNTVYVSTGIFDREAANSDPLSNTAGGEGVLKSTDGGETWAPINEGIGNPYIGSLFMHPEDSQILLAGAGNNAYFRDGGIYLTTDGGAHWQHVGGEHIQSVEFASSDPSVAYAGGSGEFMRSEDGGHTWRHYNHPRGWGWGPDGIRPGFPIDFQVDPRDPMRIFVNNYGGGNFLSEDGGQTWVSASTGYSGADLSDISVNPDAPAIVYVNGRSGPFVSQDGGVNWQGINPIEVSEIAEGARVSIDPHNPDHILASSAHWGWTYESFDAGSNWSLNTNYNSELMNLPWPNMNQKFQGLQAISLAPSNPDKVYGGFGIWRCATDADPEMCNTPPWISILTSDDGGQTWLKQEGTALDDYSVTEIVVHPQDVNIAWAATAGGGVFMTADGGETWEPRSDGLWSLFIMSLAIDPTDALILYAGTADRGIFISGDSGQTWTSSSAGMDPNEPIGAIVVDPLRPNVIYVGSWRSGVYLSEDGGSRWRSNNEGLRTRSVRALAISSDGETLYAATRGEGVFRLSTLTQYEFDALKPPDPTPAPTPVETGIHIDGTSDDWDGRAVLHDDPAGDGENGFLDLTTGHAFIADDGLYFTIDTVDPDQPFVHFDIMFQADDRMLQISWKPGNPTGFIGDVTSGWEPIGDTAKSEFAFGSALEGRISLDDLGSPDSINLRQVNVMVGECCEYPDWRAADDWYVAAETPFEDN